jgi:pyruvate/2-oxoacid:ferredoxin oxidoreductase alpha subunit
MKGNEVLAEAAMRAGCRFFFGYPITLGSTAMKRNVIWAATPFRPTDITIITTDTITNKSDFSITLKLFH